MFKERKDNFSFDLLLSISKEINILFKDKSFYNTILVDQLCEILRSSTTPGK